VSKYNAVFGLGIPIQEMPVSSVILHPKQYDVVARNGHIHVQGWAFSGGTRWIERVEVSSDGGHAWHLVPAQNLGPKFRHAWRLWSVNLPVHIEGWVQLRCRAVDNALNTQPAEMKDFWNWSGHLINSHSRIDIFLLDKRRSDTTLGIENLQLQGCGLVPVTAPALMRQPDALLEQPNDR
jgi:sulfite oxidase